MGRPLQGEIRQCTNCHKQIRVSPSAIKRGKGKFCSKDCANTGKSVTKHCQICNKEFTTYQTLIDLGKGKFCSRTCYEQDWSKRIPGWNKGKLAIWNIGNQYRKGILNLKPNKMFAEANHNWKGGVSVGEENRKNYFLVKCNERRARKMKAFGSFTPEQWKELKARYGNKCLSCGQKEGEITLSQDHVVPLIHGGSNNIDNIQPLCRSCNSKKNSKTIDYR